MQEKYISLLLERCLKVDENSSLFISYKKINKDFVLLVEKYAKELGVKDIFLQEDDSLYIHDLLKKLDGNEIKEHKLFNSHIWDEYAKKDAAFLMLDTEIPKLMDDIDSDKLAIYADTKLKTKPLYREKQLKSEIPWCIACVPNEKWAKEIFENSENPLDEFWNVLSKICMLDKDDPIKEWDKLLKLQEENIKKLNDLQIESLHFKNDLGTDITFSLCEDSIWASASSGKWIVNMPSYEIFTTPDYTKTKGVVYSSMPLIYNGKVIDEFSLTFENGKVVEFDAKKGKDVLEEIINSDEMMAYLGEVAIVDYDSPISNTNKVFKSTLFDENASCHIALGGGFIECIKDGDKLSKEELKDMGVNDSNNHVDFMIGTKDLMIEAETKDGMITIMKDGNLII